MDQDRIAPEQEIETFSLKNFIYLCLGYWKWFLLSVIFFGGIGYLYLYKKQPVYERYEEILIKDQEGGGGIAGVSNAFSSLGLFSSNTKVYNELIAFTSPAVIFEVVERLNLTMNYTERDGLKSKTLYGSSLPFLVEFTDAPADKNIGLRVKMLPNGNFVLSKMWAMGEGGRIKYTDEVKGKLDGPGVKSPLGEIIVKRNDAFRAVSKDKYDDELVVDVFRQTPQLAVEKYTKLLSADLSDQDADVIKLSIDDTSVQRADDILNMLVLVYNERWMQDNNKVSLATSKFIDERLAVIEKELGDVDNKIADQKSAMKVPDLSEAAKALVQEGIKVNESMFEVSNKLAMSQYLREYIMDPKNTYNVIPMNSGVENPVLEQEISSYNQLLLQRNTLADNSSDENPIVSDMNHQLQGLRNSILRSTESHIANLQNTLNNIDKVHDANINQLGEVPQQAKSLLSVERQQLVMQELYLFLLQKREENELTQTFAADNNRIITPPFGLQKPVSPKKMLIMIVAIILGLGIPAISLFLAETSNTKIRSKKDLENLPLPFAGEIPQIGRKKKITRLLKSKKQKQKAIDKPKIVVVEGKRDIPNEAFRVVRSNIDLLVGRGQKAAIAVTSLNPGSGKSFVAYNLGMSFALKGKKVLLIDGDLRHGSLSIYVDSPRKGISNYLNGDSSDWHKLVVNSKTSPNLSVLPLGYKPPNPAELLENGKLESLLREAETEYDVIMIDCPPVNIVVDTQIINQYVSRTLFVVRAGLFEKKGLAEIVALDKEKKLKNIAVLLNGTTTEFSSYHTYGNYEAIEKNRK